MINNIRTDAPLLSINYVLYTDGDQEFKRELISFMISNVKELKWSISNRYDDFKRAAHKVKSTLTIIDCWFMSSHKTLFCWIMSLPK
jgi:hypothetical protein